MKTILFVIGVLCCSMVSAKSHDSSDSSRIRAIALTGKYIKKSDTKSVKKSSNRTVNKKTVASKRLKKYDRNNSAHKLVDKNQADNNKRIKNRQSVRLINSPYKNKVSNQTKVSYKKVSYQSYEKTRKKDHARNKNTNKKSKKGLKKKSRNRSAYCLGGSYKALAKKSHKHDKAITKYSLKYNVPKALIKAVITAESCFNTRAVSPKGAQGLMQLMPQTAKRFGVSDSFKAEANIRGGTRYLHFLLKHFEEDLLHVIAAYNAGEGAVRKYKGIPPYKETRNYVSKVAALYKLYSQGHGELSYASVSSLSNKWLIKSIFVPRAMPKSRFSPYKGRLRNISRGKCAHRTSTRLRKSTRVESGNGVWQRIYTVKKTDSLMTVMQRTGVHKSKIMQMNGLSSRARLKYGQQLLVWECRK